MKDVVKALRDPKLLVVLLMGFSSGLPLALIGSTLKLWLTELKVDLTTIGLFSLVGMPYAWKFVWSPLMDRFVPPLGRRRGWLIISQLGVALTLIVLSFVDARVHITWFAGLAMVVAFFSASQDIVVDAYRREVLPDHELGLGSSLYVFGYRVAILVAGAGALLLADHIPWQQVYWVMALFMGVGILTTLVCREPQITLAPPRTMRESVVGPLLEFLRRDGAWTILAFVLLYKIGESMASDMTGPFLRQIGFTKTEISMAGKTFGFWATVIGGFYGGLLIVRLGVWRSLWICGALQSLALLLFTVLGQMGLSRPWLLAAVGGESFTSAMATSAFVAFMAMQTNRRFTATQYALLSSLMGVPRIFFGASTGWLAASLGWSWYFVACAVFTLPGFLILLRLRRFMAETSGASS